MLGRRRLCRPDRYVSKPQAAPPPPDTEVARETQPYATDTARASRSYATSPFCACTSSERYVVTRERVFSVAVKGR